jgi:hypothetical protein
MRSSELLALLMLAGCPPSGPDDTDGKTPFACELGEFDLDGSLVSYADKGTAELVLGFQSLLFLQVRAVADDPPAKACNATLSIELEGDDPTGGEQPLVEWHGDGLSDELLFFLPSLAVSSYVDRSATLAVRLESEDAVCLAVSEVVLVDDDPCIHTGGEPICPDD